MGKGAADLALVGTFNIGTIKGGLKVNMISGNCVFEADIRLPISPAADIVMERIHSILEAYPEAKVEIQKAASNPAAACAHDHPIVEILAKNGEVHGKEAGRNAVTWCYRL